MNQFFFLYLFRFIKELDVAKRSDCCVLSALLFQVRLCISPSAVARAVRQWSAAFIPFINHTGRTIAWMSMRCQKPIFPSLAEPHVALAPLIPSRVSFLLEKTEEGVLQLRKLSHLPLVRSCRWWAAKSVPLTPGGSLRLPHLWMKFCSIAWYKVYYGVKTRNNLKTTEIWRLLEFGFDFTEEERSFYLKYKMFFSSGISPGAWQCTKGSVCFEVRTPWFCVWEGSDILGNLGR